MEFFKHKKVYNFVKWSTPAFIISVIACVATVVLYFAKGGFELGVDFAGGTIVQLQYDSPAPLDEIRSALDAIPEFSGAQVSEFGNPNEVLIKLGSATSSVVEDTGERISSILKDTGNFTIRRVDIVGPKVGDELKEKGIVALILAMLSILVYVGYRYEWRFAFAAILAIVHDVIIAVGAILVCNIDLSLEVVAALLTLIGYSINDTIIIFDRIRETIGTKYNDSLENVINEALSATLSRTMLTSLTVFFVVLTLYLFGGEIIVGFSLPMLVGSIVGSYSSLFIATKLIMIFGFDLQKYHQKEAELEKRRAEKKKMRAMYERGQI